MKIDLHLLYFFNLILNFRAMTQPKTIVHLLTPGEIAGPQDKTPAAQLTYHGGPLLTNVQVVLVFWGATWTQSAQSPLIHQLNQFFDFILTSAYINLLAEYSAPGQAVGHGSRIGTFTIADSEPGGGMGRVTDAEIQQSLKNWIANGTISPTSNNTLYFVYLAPNIISFDGFGFQSCADIDGICGYHNQIDKSIFYAVVPFVTCAGCSFGQMIDTFTKISSHLLCEAIIDPCSDAWFDDTAPNNEIGDICNATVQKFGDFTIQAEWSNGANACLFRPRYEAAFQANTGNLWSVGADNHDDWQLGMMVGTSPSIAALPGGGYVVAFQANTGNLWTAGADNHGDWGLGMMAGTSPSIAALPDGGYEVAFQANTGNLWTVGAENHGDWQVGMMAGTSPSITALTGGGYEVAFQANTGNLWTVGEDYHGDRKVGMMAGTSPSITALSDGGYEVAFQANTGNLWTVGEDNHGDWEVGMMKGTSPSITALSDGGYEMAFQANTGNLWTVGADNHRDWLLGMMAGTSPCIVNLPSGYEVAFQASTGNLWTVGTDNRGDWEQGMMAGTSPVLAG